MKLTTLTRSQAVTMTGWRLPSGYRWYLAQGLEWYPTYGDMVCTWAGDNGLFAVIGTQRKV